MKTRATAALLFHCCTNNANQSHVSVRSIFSNCHFLFGYLHRFVQYRDNCKRLNYHTVSMRRTVSQTRNTEVSCTCETTTNVVDFN